jgi:hypothetical protein
LRPLFRPFPFLFSTLCPQAFKRFGRGFFWGGFLWFFFGVLVVFFGLFLVVFVRFLGFGFGVCVVGFLFVFWAFGRFAFGFREFLGGFVVQVVPACLLLFFSVFRCSWLGLGRGICLVAAVGSGFFAPFFARFAGIFFDF